MNIWWINYSTVEECLCHLHMCPLQNAAVFSIFQAVVLFTPRASVDFRIQIELMIFKARVTSSLKRLLSHQIYQSNSIGINLTVNFVPDQRNQVQVWNDMTPADGAGRGFGWSDLAVWQKDLYINNSLRKELKSLLDITKNPPHTHAHKCWIKHYVKYRNINEHTHFVTNFRTDIVLLS